MDNRNIELAKILVDHSVKVQKGSNVVIDASDFTAIDLIREVYKLCIERGANTYLDIFGTNYAIGRADFGGLFQTFLNTASLEQLSVPPEIMNKKMEWGNKFIRIVSIHNRNFLTSTDADKISAWNKSYYPIFEKMINKDWVLTYFPTVGTAQNAKMSLEQFTDYYYKACLADYKSMGQEIKNLQDILDEGSVVRIVGKDTDLKIGIKGRLAAGADAGTYNVPDGECFIAPIENETEGHIYYEYPQVYSGNEVSGIRLEFKEGRIVNFSAETGFEYLSKMLNDHEGNKCLGELGIGMNDMIQGYIKDILFDEKIRGTVHLALGKAYEQERGGGKNKGSIHWDMIKELRYPGSRVEVDGRAIIVDGVVVI